MADAPQSRILFPASKEHGQAAQHQLDTMIAQAEQSGESGQAVCLREQAIPELERLLKQAPDAYSRSAMEKTASELAEQAARSCEPAVTKRNSPK